MNHFDIIDLFSSYFQTTIAVRPSPLTTLSATIPPLTMTDGGLTLATWSFAPIGGSSGWLVMLIGVVLLLLCAIKPTGVGSRLTPRRLWTLRALRIAAVIVILIPMLRPVYTSTTTQNRPATFAILVDGSRSMEVADAENGKTRWDSARSVLDAIAPELANLSEFCTIQPYLFDESLRPLSFDADGTPATNETLAMENDATGNNTVKNDLIGNQNDGNQPTSDKNGSPANLATTSSGESNVPLEPVSGKIRLPEKPVGNSTAIGASLDALVRREAGKRLISALIVGDGAQRALPPNEMLPQIAAARLAARGTLVDVVPIGSTLGGDGVRDILLSDFLVPDQVFSKHELPVQAMLAQRGFAGTQVEIELIAERNTLSSIPASTKKTSDDVTTTEDATATDTKSGWQREDVQRMTVVLPTQGETPIRFAYRPAQAGCYRLSMRVVPQPGELETKNNLVTTFLDVSDGGVRVLYVEGFPPRAEQKFIVRALEESPEIDLSVVHLRNPSETAGGGSAVNGQPIPDGSERFAQRPVEMRERLRPEGCNVFLIGDLDADCWTTSELEQIATAVDHGAGLGMLGGFHSFGAGGYAETPLAALLPISMQAIEHLQPGESPAKGQHLEKSLTVRPVQTALEHPSVLIGSLTDSLTQNATNATDTTDSDTTDSSHTAVDAAALAKQSVATWSKLPPLDGANRWTTATLKPAAQRILESTQGDPLLAIQHYGRGRVWAFAGDSTWHWAMEGAESAHTRFWRQSILWLAGTSGYSANPVRLRIPRRQLMRGSESPIFVQIVPNEKVTQTPRWTVHAELVAQNGSRTEIALVRDATTKSTTTQNTQNTMSTTTAQNHTSVAKDSEMPVNSVTNETAEGTAEPSDTAAYPSDTEKYPSWRGVLPDTLPDGEYRVEVRGFADEKPLGEAITWVASRFRDPEMEYPVADPTLLEQVAAVTGGRRVLPEEIVPRLRERIAELSDKTQITVERPTTLWDHWIWLLLVTVLLGTDWTLRRLLF